MQNIESYSGNFYRFLFISKVSDITGLIFLDKPLAFGFIPSNLSPEIVPENSSLISFFTVVDLKDIKNKNKTSDIHRELRNVILSFFPKIEDFILHERPLFHEMVDGIEVNTQQHSLKRPNNLVKGKEGIINKLFITGDSVGGEGSGGDIGHTSVRNCFKKILES